jgi:hypothetical protein
MEWICINNAQPKEGEVVLITDGMQIAIVQYINNGNGYDFNDINYVSDDYNDFLKNHYHSDSIKRESCRLNATGSIPVLNYEKYIIYYDTLFPYILHCEITHWCSIPLIPRRRQDNV